jgi:hypothetical protein
LISPVILTLIPNVSANPDKKQKRELGTDLGTLLDPNGRKYEASPRCIALYKRPVIEITMKRVQRDCIDPLKIPKSHIGEGEYDNPVFDRNGDVPADKVPEPEFTDSPSKLKRSSSTSKNSRVLTSRIFSATVIKSGFNPATTVDFRITGLSIVGGSVPAKVNRGGGGSILVEVHFNGKRLDVINFFLGVETLLA